MPFKSEKQRKWMQANKPEMAKRWEKGYKKGGLVDNILARLTEGEYVIKQKSAEKLGTKVLDYLNRYGKIPKFNAKKRRG